MRRINLILILTVISSLLTAICQAQALIQYVNPFIGTDGHGHTYPGPSVPFGMVQLSPDTDYDGWDRCSGYDYSDSSILGFTHTHLSGTGVRDLNDLLLMPTLGEVEWYAGKRDEPNGGYRSPFSHKNENAAAGYYSVLLDDFKIKAELTTTAHVGVHRYTFPASKEANIIIDPIQETTKDAFWNFGDVNDVEINILNDSTIEGVKHSTGWASRQNFYFVIQFSKAFIDYGMLGWERDLIHKVRVKNEKQTKAFVRFNTKEGESIVVKVAVSSVSKEGAMMNLLAEVPHFDFDKVKKQCQDLWEKQLSKIKIETTEAQKQTFYTAMYHSCLAPNVISDVNGKYVDTYNHRVKKASGTGYYSTFSLWDTFRAANPLYTITNPDKTADFINSFIDFHEDRGFLPFWPLWGSETYCMIGNHAVPVIVDAYFKGIKGFDVEKAYKAIYSSSTKPAYKSEVDVFHQYDYFPSDKIRIESVSKTLEHAYNDWCVAQMAKALGKTDDYNFFSKSAQAYKNVYDAQTGFMRGKKSDGSWDNSKPFNAYKFEPTLYTEATAWQYLWYVPQDVDGLISLMGGKEKFSSKLDTLFKVSSKFEGERSDISGLIGQYAHGNEPSHHIAYLFNYAGKPWLTQFYLDKIMKTQYNNSPSGLCGNEDCGQMSAWYIFSLMGIYPVNPANGIYDIGSPRMKSAKIDMGNGKVFSINTKNYTSDNCYVQSIKLNGITQNRLSITHQDMLKGGTLEIALGPKANMKLGR
jgi:predicted alpha-1,2-mannosidase